VHPEGATSLVPGRSELWSGSHLASEFIDGLMCPSKVLAKELRVNSADTEEVRRRNAESKLLTEANAVPCAASIFVAAEFDSRNR